MSEINQAMRDGKVKSGYDFGSAAEVAALWGLRLLPGCAEYKIEDGATRVTIVTARERMRPTYGPKADERGWCEIVAFDTDRDISCDGETPESRTAEPGATVKTVTENCHVFRREERAGQGWYKYYGVFRRTAESVANKQGRLCFKSAYYERTSDEGSCPKRTVKPVLLDDGAFAALKGRTLCAALVDWVRGIRKTTEDELIEEAVTVVPGETFRVGEICGDIARVGRTFDGKEDASGAVYEIPRRDLELGYFVAA